jgi:hypothetical protein
MQPPGRIVFDGAHRAVAIPVLSNMNPVDDHQEGLGVRPG